ncbi:AAA family ATPase [Pelagibius sp. Alg239-R121]|uniref:AAA family ATPase n=1 Tax=Pelagibius sp. Alg239-R121 TaxID=2993448 RepID=UPI0024A774BA|nr:AAA family ATPase [Pelagibius sp. Alg239-R121]
MKLVIIVGPPAVGKMTVGQELEKLSGYKLFHNHMTIEMVAPFFSYGSRQGRRLVQRLRHEFFEAFSEDCGPGYIFTYVWAFGEAGEREYIEGVADKFAKKGHEVFWIELEASLDERLKRNRTENRLKHKPSKRDLAWSDNNVLNMSDEYRLNSSQGEIEHPNYLRIDNTRVSAPESARQIWAYVK